MGSRRIKNNQVPKGGVRGNEKTTGCLEAGVNITDEHLRAD